MEITLESLTTFLGSILHRAVTTIVTLPVANCFRMSEPSTVLLVGGLEHFLFFLHIGNNHPN